MSKTIRFSIGFKLITIISFLLIVSLGAITALVSYMVGGDVRVTAEQNNLSVNQRSAAEAELLLSSTRGSALSLLDTLDTLDAADAAERTLRQTVDYFFERNANIAFIGRLDKNGLLPREIANTRFFLEAGVDSSVVAAFTASRPAAVTRCAAGELVAQSAAEVFGAPALALYCPRQRGAETGALVLFTADSLAESFGSGMNLSCLINDDGEMLAAYDSSFVVNGGADSAFSGSDFIKSVWDSPERGMQTLYADSNGVEYFGAFTKLDSTGAAVITSVEQSAVLAGVAATTRRNLFLTGAVLCLSVLFIWFFSKTLSRPLRNLTDAARRIEEGEFEVDLKTKSRDELGVLTESFVSMGRGLAERERLKDTFGRFTNKEIAEKALKGELTLGGENKTVTVFFSDIRAFTEISEKLEPAEVVHFLNEYMTRMVACVNKTNGVVDKFIGDAVMAVWGAPVSAGSPAKDAFNCVKSALLMRAALAEFNKDRGGARKPLIRIGCGINSGDVIAGQIGSSQRMEYTVIGDSVNLASRTEALNKPFATDILITENTWKLVGEYFITEEMPPVSVKGKEKPVRLFAVINLKPKGGAEARPSTIKELRALLGISAPDLRKVNVDAEEKKYKIG